MAINADGGVGERLEEILSERIVLLDGSMGALIYSRTPQESDFHGQRFRTHPVSLMNCTEALVLTQPRMIEDIHRAYLDAGADIIETCTFNVCHLSIARSRPARRSGRTYSADLPYPEPSRAASRSAPTQPRR